MFVPQGNETMTGKITMTGIAPRRPGDTKATPLNEVVLALAAETEAGASVYQIHLALGNSDLPSGGLGVTLNDQVKAGRLERDQSRGRDRRYRITQVGGKWLHDRGVSAGGMARVIAGSERHHRLKFNTGIPDDAPIPTIASTSGPSGTVREWLGLSREIAGRGEWAWANLDTAPTRVSPRRYRSASPTPEQPGNDMTPRVLEALKTGTSIPPLGRPEAVRLIAACRALSVNAIRRAMEVGAMSQATIAEMLTRQLRRTNPLYPTTRFAGILRGRLLPDAQEAHAVADTLGIATTDVAPHLTVAAWLHEQWPGLAEPRRISHGRLDEGRLGTENRDIVESVLSVRNVSMAEVTLDHLDQMLDAARRQGREQAQR
jgi:hypothetical protein